MGAVFLHTLAGGMMATLSTARLTEVGWGFLRNAALIPAAILTGITTWQLLGKSPESSTVNAMLNLGAASGGGLALLAAFVSPVAVRRAGLFRAACLGSAISATASGCGWLLRTTESPPLGQAPAVMAVFSQLCAAGLLGSITVSWLLGHAYLTATRMTIAPLKHFTRLLSWSLAVRGVSVLALLLAAWVLMDDSGGDIFVRLSRAWLIVSLRIGVGLVAVGAFAYMVRDCVRLRSTQSATGILYFGSVFAYVGELCALQFLDAYGWPL